MKNNNLTNKLKKIAKNADEDNKEWNSKRKKCWKCGKLHNERALMCKECKNA